MNHRQLRFHNWTLLLGCMAAVGTLACVDSPRPANGEAGASGTGGPGSGGVHLGTGGGAGGVDGGGITSSGTGGTIPSIPCATEAECTASGLVCEAVTKHCAQCTKTADCPSGQHCRANVCVSLPADCTTSLQCGTDKVCDPARGLCVQCATKEDCTAAPGKDCVANTCVPSTICVSSLDCGTKVCDPTSKKCVDCAGDNDCNAPGATTIQHCIKSVCKPECTSDKQCTPQGMLCDTTSKVCAQCKSNADCPASSFCDGGQCKPDVCDSTEAMCSGNGIAQCNAAGSGWAAVSKCPADKPCQASRGASACGGVVPVDGGTNPAPIDGGLSPNDGPITGCTTATANLCDGIPRFDGTQTVDGKDDDFCQVPLFPFIKPSAAVVNNYNNIQDSEFPVINARVAWSAAGLHAFFDVTDASVQSVAMKDPGAATQKPYQGDSIELFFTSNDTPSGAPGSDPGAVHVTLAATGPSVSVRTTNSNGISTTYTELPAAQYKSGKTATGYAIEALIPWVGGAPSGGKVRFDLAVNVADTNCSGADDMRDAQMVLRQSTVSGQTSCPGGAEAWCDDRTWCSTTLQ